MTRRTWVVGYGSLTPEQRRVVELDDDQNHLVTGPAGSGKTLLLLHRARHFLHQRGVDPDRIRALVYTRVLKSYVQSGSDALRLPDGIVQSFYSWLWSIARERDIPLPSGGTDDTYFRSVEIVADWLDRYGDGPFLDVALVDEGQDLSADAYRVLMHAARHVTVFGDDAQRLYDVGASLDQAARHLGLGRRSFTLIENLRNTSGVARAAACFLDRVSATEYLRSQAVHEHAVRTPVLYRAYDRGDEWDRLATVTDAEIRDGKRIGILVPGNKLVGVVANRLQERGVEVDKVWASRATETDFHDLTPKVMTTYGAKGLTFDSVLIPCAELADYTRHSTPPEALLFVATTRALEWVFYSARLGREAPELERLRPLIDTGGVEEQFPDTDEPLEPDDDEDFDDDLPL